MHPYYALLGALRPGQPVTLTIDAGTFDTTAHDALATLDALAPGELFNVEAAS